MDLPLSCLEALVGAWLVAQAAAIHELIENNSVLLGFLELRCRIQQMQFDSFDAVEVVTKVE